jgi:hypothetical protein
MFYIALDYIVNIKNSIQLLPNILTLFFNNNNHICIDFLVKMVVHIGTNFSTSPMIENLKV